MIGTKVTLQEKKAPQSSKAPDKKQREAQLKQEEDERKRKEMESDMRCVCVGRVCVSGWVGECVSRVGGWVSECVSRVGGMCTCRLLRVCVCVCVCVCVRVRVSCRKKRMGLLSVLPEEAECYSLNNSCLVVRTHETHT